MDQSTAGTFKGVREPMNGLLQDWPGVFFRQRLDFTFDHASSRIEEVTGIAFRAWRRDPKLFWQVVHELDAEELKRQIARCAESAQGMTSTYRVRNVQTGRVIYLWEFRRAILNSRATLEGYEGVWLDVTRQAIAEKRLATVAWKETLALLTMDLTHDFNNMLTGILSLSQSYRSQAGPEHPFHEGLGLISQNARQANQLVHLIIRLHQGKTGHRNYHDLNEVTSESVELLRKVIPRSIEVTTELEGTSLPLYVDAVEFRQVIINLAMNAAEAMPDRGKLVFRTSLHQEMPALENFQGVMPRLPSACLLVADNGCGIKAHQLSSIFDPFFTTKAMNKGSGLGLYNAKLFVEKHHGAISVKSTEAGTDFGVWLPIANFAEAEQAQELSNQRRRTILLVGQTGKSLDGMAEFLRLHNYHVVAVARGAEELLQANEDNFDGLMVQVEAKETGNLSLIGVARRLQLPLKTMVQIIGCNQDELETESLLKADLLISADMSPESILKELVAMFESRG